MKKLLAIFVAAFELLAVLLPITVAPDIGVDATVEVVPVCELTVDTTPLAFGSLLQGEEFPGVLTRSVDLDANTPTIVDISGTVWTGFFTGETMPVGQTHYDLDSSTKPLSFVLSSGPTLLFSTSVDESHFVGFDVRIPDPQTADDYSQTVTFTFDCGD